MTKTFVNGMHSFSQTLAAEVLDVPVTKLMSKSKCHNPCSSTSFVTILSLSALMDQPFIFNPLIVNGLTG